MDDKVDRKRIEWLKKEIAKACENYQHKKLDKLLSELGKPDFQIETTVNGLPFENETPLSKVCTNTKSKAGRFESIEVLLKHGADIDYPIDYYEAGRKGASLRFDGATPLMLVVRRLDLINVAEYLINNSADVNAKNPRNKDRSALHYAVQVGNIGVVKLLVEHGADIKAVDKYGNNLLHYSCAYDDAELSTKMALLLAKNGLDFDSKNRRGKSAMDILLGSHAPEDIGEIIALIEQRTLNDSISNDIESAQRLDF